MVSCQLRDGVVWAIVLSPAFVSGNQLLGGLRALGRSAGFPKGTGLLIDARALRDDVRGHTPSELATTVSELGNLGIGRCALVPAPGRIRQAERFAEVAESVALPMAVFAEPQRAMRWLVKGERDESAA